MWSQITQTISGQLFKRRNQCFSIVFYFGIIIRLILEFSRHIIHQNTGKFGNRTVKNTKSDQSNMETWHVYRKGLRKNSIIDQKRKNKEVNPVMKRDTNMLIITCFFL